MTAYSGQSAADLWGIGRIARRIGVSQVTAAAYLRAGKIDSTIIEGRLYAHRADVEAFAALLPGPIPRSRRARETEMKTGMEFASLAAQWPPPIPRYDPDRENGSS